MQLCWQGHMGLPSPRVGVAVRSKGALPPASNPSPQGVGSDGPTLLLHRPHRIQRFAVVDHASPSEIHFMHFNGSGYDWEDVTLKSEPKV